MVTTTATTTNNNNNRLLLEDQSPVGGAPISWLLQAHRNDSHLLSMPVPMELHSVDYEHLAVSEEDVRQIVLSYLVHNCFKETAEAFISSTGMKWSADWATELDKRKTIYSLALKGDALKAIDLLNQLDPDLLLKNRDVLFDLLTLHFVELVRARNCTGALEFAQRELTPFGKLQKYTEKLQDFVTLLAYEEPEKSPVFELLSMDHRQNVADGLNRVVLEHHKLPNKTALEKLSQQLAVVQSYLNHEHAKKGLPPLSMKNFYECLQ